MSRYTREGVTRDLQAGKRVALIGPRREVARATFLGVCDTLRMDSTVKRALIGNANEHIEMHNGGRLDVVTPQGVRGRTYDVLVLIDWREIPTEKLEPIYPALNRPDGELLHA